LKTQAARGAETQRALANAAQMAARSNAYAVGSSSIPKKIERENRKSGSDWMKQAEAVDVKENPQVLEMVERFANPSAGKKPPAKKVPPKMEPPKMEPAPKKEKEKEKAKELDRQAPTAKPSMMEIQRPSSNQVDRSEEKNGPATSPENASVDSDDEFDRAFAAAPAKPKPSKKAAPKAPPPGKPPSRGGSRQGSRESSPRPGGERGSRAGSRDASPRPGDPSPRATPATTPTEDGRELTGGEVTKIKKKKKEKKEKKKREKEGGGGGEAEAKELPPLARD
jgi:hypothetical protein